MYKSRELPWFLIASMVLIGQANEASSMVQQALKEEHGLKLDFLSTLLKHVSTFLKDAGVNIGPFAALTVMTCIC